MVQTQTCLLDLEKLCGKGHQSANGTEGDMRDEKEDQATVVWWNENRPVGLPVLRNQRSSITLTVTKPKLKKEPFFMDSPFQSFVSFGVRIFRKKPDLTGESGH